MARDGIGARRARRTAGASIAAVIVLAAGQAPAAGQADGWPDRRDGDPPSWADVVRWWASSSPATWPWTTPRPVITAPKTPDPEPPAQDEPPAPEKPVAGPKTPPVTTSASQKGPPVAAPVPEAPPAETPPVAVAPAPTSPAPPAPVAAGAPAPRLEVRKTGPARVRAGSVAHFRVTVANRGAGPAREVRVADILPAGFALVRAGGAGPRLSAGRPTWRIARLAAGASRAFVIAVRAPSPMRPGARCNRVRVTAPGASPAQGRACFTVTAAPPRRRVPAVTG